MIRNYATYTLINIVNIAVSLVLMVFFVNKLSTKDYSVLGVYAAFLSIVIVFINFGHKEALFKCSSKRQTDKLLSNCASAMRLVLIGGCVFLVIGGFNRELMLAAFYLLSMHLLQIMASINRGFGNIFRDAGAILMYRIGWLVIAFCFFYFSDENLTASHVFLAGIIVASLIIPMIAKKEWFIISKRDELSDAKAARLSTLKRFFLIELLTTAYLKVDVIILKLSGYDATNISSYYLSVQLLEAALLLMAPLAYLFFNLANNALNRNSEFDIMKPATLTLVVASFGVFSWYLVGEWLLALFFPQYIDSFSLSLLLLSTAIPASINMVLSYQVVARNLEYDYLRIIFIGLVSMVASTLFLESILNVYSPAFGKLLSEVIMFAAFTIILVRNHRKT